MVSYPDLGMSDPARRQIAAGAAAALTQINDSTASAWCRSIVCDALPGTAGTGAQLACADGSRPRRLAVDAEMKATAKTANVLSRYTPWHRAVDLAAIAVFGALLLWNLARLAGGLRHSDQIWPIAAAGLAAWVAVDLLSGMVHWAFDTWGSVHTPLVGARYIRPFREHHWDPHAMTRHDFVETNGSSCVGALPLLVVATMLPTRCGRLESRARVPGVHRARSADHEPVSQVGAPAACRGSVSSPSDAAVAADPAAGGSSAASRAPVRFALLHGRRLAERAVGCAWVLSCVGAHDRGTDTLARSRRRSRLIPPLRIDLEGLRNRCCRQLGGSLRPILVAE